MAELNRDQRFLPCLLDRLRDDDPKNKEESRNQRVISAQRYKEGVLRDLRWLFNASAHLPVEGREEFKISDYPEVERSVLNFGTRQLCGLIAPDMGALERELSQAVDIFEPRISRHTVSIRASHDRHLIAFEMRCEIWAEPIPEQLFVKTTIDLEAGQFNLGDSSNG
jgi:type VI secretion system protein ImpF